MKRISIESPAKINLFLRIVGKRSDGYHDILSLMQMVDLSDVVEVSRADDFAIDVRGAKIAGENIVERAYRVLCDATGKKPPVFVRIFKIIPMGAGLGGGSSNAAAFLLGMNRLFEMNLSEIRLAEIGARVGSDVPFFFSHGSALVRGRGEIVESVRIPTKYNIVLIIPPFGIDTSRAYSMIKKGLTLQDKAYIVKNYFEKEFWNILPDFGNDFEGVVCGEHPELSEQLSLLRGMGAEFTGLSGSGSAIFAIFRNHALAMRALMHRWNGKTYLAKPILRKPIP